MHSQIRWRERPLGIAALEDKAVQQAVVTVLNEIYEAANP
jgi:RNA-directed DNA polymerase